MNEGEFNEYLQATERITKDDADKAKEIFVRVAKDARQKMDDSVFEILLERIENDLV